MKHRWTEGVRREVLPNGLTVLAQKQSAAPAAAVVTHVKAGFFDEPDHWIGVSHVLEHMFFKGTPTRGPGQIAQETKAAGGYLNAGTSYDYTSYYVVLPSGSLATALDIQSDALQRSVIDGGELARELQVIIQEAKRKRDSPGAVTTETLFEVMYDRHRIRRWRIGNEDHLARLTRDDVWGYYRSRYVPRNTVVAIVGNIDPDEALELATVHYRGWEDRAPATDRSPKDPPRSEVRVRTLRGDVAQAHLALGWRTVPPLHRDEAALELTAAVLSAGRGSWLYRSLRATGVVSAVSAYSYAPTELGLFGVGFNLGYDRVGQALEAVGENLGRLADRGPSEDDLERARTLLITRWSRRMEPTDGRASALAGAEALESYQVLDDEFDRLRRTTVEDIRRVVRQYLDPESVSAVGYLPEHQGTDLGAEDVAERLRHSAPAMSVIEEIPVALPATVRVPLAGMAPWSVVALDGVDLIVRPKMDVPTITIGVFGRREPSETSDIAGLGALGVRSAVRGFGRHDAASVAVAFETGGGAVNPVFGSERFGFRATVHAGRAAETASLLRLLIEDASFKADEVEHERSVMIEEAHSRRDDMFGYPFQLALGAAFGDAGYGVPLGGTPESLARLDVEAVASGYRRLVDGARLTVVAVGAADPQMLADQLAAVFDGAGGSAEQPSFEPEMVSLDAPGRVELRAKEQTALAMVFPGPSHSDPDRYAAEVWASIAGGLGGRLFEILRSQESLAYTVVASSWQRRQTGALLAYLATTPARETEARVSLLRELQRFAAEPVAPVELERAASYLAGQREISRQSSMAVMNEIVDAWLTAGDLTELVEPWQRYRDVTVEDVYRVCTRSLGNGAGVEGVIRGEQLTGEGPRT